MNNVFVPSFKSIDLFRFNAIQKKNKFMKNLRSSWRHAESSVIIYKIRNPQNSIECENQAYSLSIDFSPYTFKYRVKIQRHGCHSKTNGKVQRRRWQFHSIHEKKRKKNSGEDPVKRLPKMIKYSNVWNFERFGEKTI